MTDELNRGPIRALVKRIRAVEKLAFRAATQPQLAYSTIEDGAVQSRSDDGSLSMIVGKQFDGTQSVAILNGPVPPTPNAPTVNAALESVDVFWDGTFALGEFTPMNFGRVEIHASIDPDFPATAWETLIGFFNSPRGGQISRNLVPATYYIKLVAVSQSGVRSVPSAAATVTPIDIHTVIENPADTAPDAPATSPEITAVRGNATGLTVVTEPILPTTLVDFLIDGVVVAADQRTSIINLDKDGAGNPLEPEVDYVVTTQAHNAGGSPAPSAPKTARLDLGVSPENIVGILQAGLIQGNIMEIGSAMTFDQSGITITLPDGRQTILRSDGSGNQLIGQATLDALDVLGNLNIRGLTNFINGLVTMANGVGDPGQRVGVSSSYDVADVGAAGFYRKGLSAYHDVAHPEVVVTTDTLLGSSNLQTWNRDTGAAIGYTLTVLAGWEAYGGVTLLGGNYHVLARHPNGVDWKVLVYDPVTKALLTSFVTWPPTSSITPTAYPAIGNDGTNLLIAIPDSGHMFVRRIKPYGVAGAGDQVGATIDCGPWGSATEASSISGVGGKWYIGVKPTSQIFAYTTAGARSTSDQFPLGRNDSLTGAYHDGTRWTTSHGGGRFIVNYTNLSGTWDFAYTLRDSDAGGLGTAESLRSPILTFAPIKYAKWTVSLPSAPPDDGTTDGANTARIYASPTGTPLALQTSLVEPALSQSYTTLLTSGTTPPLVSGFASRVSTALGRLWSAAVDGLGEQLIKLSGDGSFRGGAYRSTSAGVVAAGGVGEVQFAVATGDANTTGTGNVTIPGLSVTLTSPGTGSLWLVDIDADVQINSGGTINIVELLLDGTPYTLTLNSSLTNPGRMSGTKTWIVTGLAAGAHTLTARTRNTVGGTDATVRTTHTTMIAVRSM